MISNMAAKLLSVISQIVSLLTYIVSAVVYSRRAADAEQQKEVKREQQAKLVDNPGQFLQDHFAHHSMSQDCFTRPRHGDGSLQSETVANDELRRTADEARAANRSSL